MAPSVESGRAPSPRTQTEFNSNLFKAKMVIYCMDVCLCRSEYDVWYGEDKGKIMPLYNGSEYSRDGSGRWVIDGAARYA